MTWPLLWLVGALGAAVAVVGALRWVRRRFVSVTVEGTSMTPALRPGDRVLVRRGLRGLRSGQIVVVARPDPLTGWAVRPAARRDLRATSWFIKRVVATGGEPYPRAINRDGIVPPGHVALLGDHVPSADSRQFGPCPTHQILGVCLRTFTGRREPVEAQPAGPTTPA